jgi:hypothetical protein
MRLLCCLDSACQTTTCTRPTRSSTSTTSTTGSWRRRFCIRRSRRQRRRDIAVGLRNDGSSASPLTLAGKTCLPRLVAGLTTALFAQSVLAPSRQVLRTDAVGSVRGDASEAVVLQAQSATWRPGLSWPERSRRQTRRSANYRDGSVDCASFSPARTGIGNRFCFGGYGQSYSWL